MNFPLRWPDQLWPADGMGIAMEIDWNITQHTVREKLVEPIVGAPLDIEVRAMHMYACASHGSIGAHDDVIIANVLHPAMGALARLHPATRPGRDARS